MDAQHHTLLLVQFNTTVASRTFLDFESLSDAMNGICALYEKELKVLNPKMPNITYDISDLYAYIDQLSDIYRTSVEHLSNIHRMHTKHLYSIHRASIMVLVRFSICRR